MTTELSGDALAKSDGADIVVCRSASASIKDIWKALVSPEGEKALLGEGGQLGDKGEDWHANDGTFGVIRSYHPLEEIRFTWYAAEEAPRTIVTLHLNAAPDGGTTVEIRHEQVPSYFDKAALAQRWETFLDHLFALAR